MALNMQWKLSSIGYLGLTKEITSIDEYNKGYFEFNTIQLILTDTLKETEVASVAISFADYEIHIEKGSIGKLFDLKKQKINEHLAGLEIPPIQDIIIGDDTYISYEEDSSETIGEMKYRDQFHTGVNVSEAPESTINKQILEQIALSDIKLYL
jgi:hypothetical protein